MMNGIWGHPTQGKWEKERRERGQETGNEALWGLLGWIGETGNTMAALSGKHWDLLGCTGMGGNTIEGVSGKHWDLLVCTVGIVALRAPEFPELTLLFPTVASPCGEMVTHYWRVPSPSKGPAGQTGSQFPQ